MVAWRKGWDSNPRGAYTPGGFQDRCLKPLGHPSPVTTSNTYALALVEQTSHRRQLATARARPRSRARASFGLRVWVPECAHAAYRRVLRREVPAGGMQLVAWCRDGMDDRGLADRLSQAAVIARPVSSMLFRTPARRSYFLAPPRGVRTRSIAR